MFKTIANIGLIGILVASCGQSTDPANSDTPTSGHIKMACDETLQPISEAEIQVFEALYTSATISPVYLTERDAFKALIDDSVRLIMASRKLSKNEEDFFNAKKIYPRQVKIATDALALLIHPSNKDSLLSTDALKEILTGTIQNWNQINAKSKLGKIQVVFDNPSSSTVRFITDSLTKSTKLSSNVAALDFNKDVIDYVSKTPNALGIIGVSWVCDRSDSTCLTFLKKVQVVALSKEKNATYENSYQPFQGYVAQKLYPLTRNIYIINAEPRQGLASGYLAFLASDRGQRIIKKMGILPATQVLRIIQVRNDF